MTTLPYTQNIKTNPKSAIGFTAMLNASEEDLKNLKIPINRALKHFDDINQITLTQGQTTLTIWGRDNISECYQQLSDGSIVILVGSPEGNYSWRDFIEKFEHIASKDGFEIPWEGRVIVLQIDPTGEVWTTWNDWLGSIPIFHAETHSGRIASTLEPVVVEACGYSSNDISRPAVLALLMWGNYFSDWTLFKGMKVVPPDCAATWNESGFQYHQNFTVKPSDDRWQVGWDDLMDEMYQLSKTAISNSLKANDHWVLPLSSGLDSRLIAGVAAEVGANVQAYTWGIPKTSDVIHAKSIAQALDIPWQYIDPGDTYLKDYRDLWASLFGSAMHFHGMYQIPFLNELPNYPILSGFIGECLAGYAVKFTNEVFSSSNAYQVIPDGYLHWTVNDLQELVNFPIDDHISEIATEVDQIRRQVPGAFFQQLSFLILWGRQRHFTYFQSLLSDYWCGVSTPYLNREYAQFSLSLPRSVFDDRILQRSMFKRYYAKLAAIPGTYAPEPALLTGSYLIKKRVGNYLPESIHKTIFPGLYRSKPNSDIQSVAKVGKNAFYPVFENLDLLGNWMDIDIIEETYSKIVLNNDGNAVRKLQSIQTLAHRLAS